MRQLIAVFAFFTMALAMPAVASAAEIVHYELKEWKSKHLHDVEKAKVIIKTLKDLGCEVEEADHDGHKDVKYRCPKRRKMPVKSHEEALKWEKWLKEYGFRAYHTH